MFNCYQEVIYKVWLPAAIRFGIPYETFWKLNPRIIGIYQDEFIKKQKENNERINYEAWLHGAYIVRAVQTALDSKRVKYPDIPFDCKEETEMNPEEKFILWIEEYNRKFDK